MNTTIGAREFEVIRAEQRKIVMRGAWALFSLYRLAGKEGHLRSMILDLKGRSDKDQVELLESLINSALDPSFAEAFAKLSESEQRALRAAAT